MMQFSFDRTVIFLYNAFVYVQLIFFRFLATGCCAADFQPEMGLFSVHACVVFARCRIGDNRR